MNITLETDYAIRIMDTLVTSLERMDAKTIAEKTGVTLRFSLKILRKLVTAGLLCSFKGTNGGYELAKDPHEITLYDVVETIEGPYTFSRCVGGDNEYECEASCDGATCHFKSVFEDISETVIEKLECVTFGDIKNKR